MNLNLLPYFDERKAPIDTLVLHSFAVSDFIDSCHRHKVSAHYFVDSQGEVTQFVNEDKRAWHAGLGNWKGISDINSSSIGIEIQNPTLGQTAFNENQIKVVVSLCKDIIKRYNIKPENIVAHSDIAPLRKADPGMCFPWQKLAEEGIGVWYNLDDSNKINTSDICELLASIGYDTKNAETINASAYAFCRRFAPQFVNVENDIYYLVENVVNTDFEFMKNPKFLEILKAVAYKYSTL